MADEVSWVFKVALKDGALEQFTALAGEMSRVNEVEEPGTLTYEWFVSPDGAAVHVYERYVNDAAALTHVQRFGANYAERLLALADVTGFDIYGPVGDDLRQAVSAFTPNFYGWLDGFAR